MPIREQVKSVALSWGDSLLPPGPLRDKVTSIARSRGVTFAPSGKPIPEHLRARHAIFHASQVNALLAGLKENVFGAQTDQFGPVEDYLATEAGAADCQDHLFERLERNRATAIPWLDSVRPLGGLRILEIGAGDGAFTVALAEQGATVSATDVNERALQVNELRCRLANLSNVRFSTMNARSLSTEFEVGDHDMVIFSASLEHMTIDERIASLRGAWNLLESGGYLVVIETPNRLWYFDDHTSGAPFFHWLPDDLAVQYARETPRQYFNSEFDGDVDPIAFARWGRGVSFHDFVLALGIPASELPVKSSMHEYLKMPRWHRHTRDGQFLRFIRQLAPDLPIGLFYSYLDIALEKPAG